MYHVTRDTSPPSHAIWPACGILTLGKSAIHFIGYSGNFSFYIMKYFYLTIFSDIQRFSYFHPTHNKQKRATSSGFIEPIVQRTKS